MPHRPGDPPGRESLPAEAGLPSRDSGARAVDTDGMHRPTPDTSRRCIGWSLAGLALLLLVSVPLSLAGGVMSRPGVVSSGPDLWVAVFVPAFVLSGGFLVHLRPRNAIGWILVVSGLLQVTNIAADAYATRALTDVDRSLPGGLPAAWLASWTWMPSLLLPALVLPAVYPEGHPPTRFWRWHVRVALVGIGLGVVAMAGGPGGVDDTVRGVELPWTAPAWASYAIGLPAAALLAATSASVVVGTLVRAVRSVTPERQQLLWLVSVVALMLATVMTGPELLFVGAYTFIPVAVTIGVLRYRLLGIEIVLRRTLLYLPLTLLVALVVGGLTTLLARLAPDGPFPLLAASAVVAVLVIPVAARLRGVVDRFVLGSRPDPLEVVDRVGAGLEVPHADPVAAMLEAVASASGATYAAVRDARGRLLAEVGTPRDECAEHPLRHGGVLLGTLAVGPRAREPHVTEGLDRLVATLAPQLAVVVASQALTTELAEERRRVTAATLNERDRLRRDLHDGLGPSLAGIALGLEAAWSALGSDRDDVREVLARLREEADAAASEVRRVLDALRPQVLDLQGLEGAIRATATSLGLGADDAGPSFALGVESLPALPPHVEEAAFRIAAESLTNVVRHADAGHCSVRVARGGGDLWVTVCDDGNGPGPSLGAEPRGGGSAGHGLDSMVRRATQLGGTLTVEPADPRGTRVTAVLPLGAGS